MSKLLCRNLCECFNLSSLANKNAGTYIRIGEKAHTPCWCSYILCISSDKPTVNNVFYQNSIPSRDAEHKTHAGHSRQPRGPKTAEKYHIFITAPQCKKCTACLTPTTTVGATWKQTPARASIYIRPEPICIGRRNQPTKCGKNRLWSRAPFGFNASTPVRLHYSYQ